MTDEKIDKSGPDPKTSGMRLTELEPCSFCGEFVGHIFRLLDVRFAVLGRGAREVAGLAAGFGFPLAIAEALAPRSEEAIVIGEDPEIVTRLFCCSECFMGPLDVAVALERIHALREKAAARKAGHTVSNHDAVQDAAAGER